MTEHIDNECDVPPRTIYTPPQLIELDEVSKVTLGKYAEDSADKGRYFE